MKAIRTRSLPWRNSTYAPAAGPVCWDSVLYGRLAADVTTRTCPLPAHAGLDGAALGGERDRTGRRGRRAGGGGRGCGGGGRPPPQGCAPGCCPSPGCPAPGCAVPDCPAPDCAPPGCATPDCAAAGVDPDGPGGPAVAVPAAAPASRSARSRPASSHGSAAAASRTRAASANRRVRDRRRLGAGRATVPRVRRSGRGTGGRCCQYTGCGFGGRAGVGLLVQARHAQPGDRVRHSRQRGSGSGGVKTWSRISWVVVSADQGSVPARSR